MVTDAAEDVHDMDLDLPSAASGFVTDGTHASLSASAHPPINSVPPSNIGPSDGETDQDHTTIDPANGSTDESALAAAAAAMAAAVQGQSLFTQSDIPDNFATPDLSSYLMAAAAASVQAQQHRDQQEDEIKAASDDSSNSAGTPAQHSAHTTGTSINGDEHDAKSHTLSSKCQKYIDEHSPYPLDAGTRFPGGFQKLVESYSSHEQAEEAYNATPFNQSKVELGKTRCYWALLSADHSRSSGPSGDRLHFVYLDPVLQQHMAQQADSLVGTDFFDYVHPEERERVCEDMGKIVESRTLFGSVTRCRYSRIPRIRELLGAVDPPRDPEAHRYVEDESFVAIDIVINWIGDGMVLCFFHAIIDKDAEDNDETHKSDWTNWCGTPSGGFTLRQCDNLWRKIRADQREAVPNSGPTHVFQVIEASGEGRVLLSWPPPRLFPRGVDAAVVAESDTAAFEDGSYFADDFARLAQGVSIAPGSSDLSDANTSCTRRFRAKHTLTTEGKVRSIESVLIPYGDVILACFHTTFQQHLPPPDPELVAQAQATLQAQAQRQRTNEADAPRISKRARIEEAATADEVETLGARVEPPKSTDPPVKDSPPTVSSQPAVQGASKPTTSAAAPSPQSSPGSKPAAARTSPAKSSMSNGSHSVSASALVSNTSHAHVTANHRASGSHAPASGASHKLGVAMYTNQSTAPVARAEKPSPPVHATSGSAEPRGSVATLATVAAAPASQNKSCTGCGKINSPEWRRGPSGHKTLCNACGLRYARSLTRRKKKKGKDGQVEFIEPTGDPSVVPKSRGGGGGSLPGVHRKNSKKRKLEEEAKLVAAAAAGNNATACSPKSNGQSADGVRSSASASPASPASPASTSDGKGSPSIADSGTVSQSGTATSIQSKVPPAPSGPPLSAVSLAAAGLCAAPPTPVEQQPDDYDAVSRALQAMAQANAEGASKADSDDALPLNVSTAISKAIAATISSTIENDSDANKPDDQPSEAASRSDPKESTSVAPLDPAVSAAALHNMGTSVSEALYQQLVQSGLPVLPMAPSISAAASKPPTLTALGGLTAAPTDESAALPGLSAEALRAAAQAAVAHGLGSGMEECATASITKSPE
ncbi:hypothetical protein BCV70DRAFT_86351 [Testicularia cyperi]|uniref:GATA-type domain-containing protein n=1 Tax=Testicularia cyperi TaxID=1882483 RepID=A0A317XRP4_9BASI|nr:hypothetical protein BCV70DRAFT_86351 [Testicularia cyperi]